jgi:radical SAM protein with 4Fe4S-binding SPASM domain
MFCKPLRKNQHMLNINQFSHIIDEIKPYTNEVLFHVLGEPLAHPNFVEFSHIAKNKGLKINITTNGKILVNKKEIIKNADFDILNISLHSTYQLKDLDLKEYISNLLSLIKELKEIDNNRVFHLRLWANSNDVIKKNNKRILDVLHEFFKFSESSRIRLDERVILSFENEFEWPSFKGIKTDNHCLGGKTHIAILSTGDVVICCLDRYGYTSYGNILNESLKDILNKEEFIKTVEEFKNNRCYKELCKYCTYKNI